MQLGKERRQGREFTKVHYPGMLSILQRPGAKGRGTKTRLAVKLTKMKFINVKIIWVNGETGQYKANLFCFCCEISKDVCTGAPYAKPNLSPIIPTRRQPSMDASLFMGSLPHRILYPLRSPSCKTYSHSSCDPILT